MYCAVSCFLFELRFYSGDHGEGGIINHFPNEAAKALKDTE